MYIYIYIYTHMCTCINGYTQTPMNRSARQELGAPPALPPSSIRSVFKI